MMMPIISNPTGAVPLLAEIKDECGEHFICVHLNARN